jgi:hypothetical protein
MFSEKNPFFLWHLKLHPTKYALKAIHMTHERAEQHYFTPSYVDGNAFFIVWRLLFPFNIRFAASEDMIFITINFGYRIWKHT